MYFDATLITAMQNAIENGEATMTNIEYGFVSKINLHGITLNIRWDEKLQRYDGWYEFVGDGVTKEHIKKWKEMKWHLKK